MSFFCIFPLPSEFTAVFPALPHLLVQSLVSECLLMTLGDGNKLGILKKHGGWSDRNMNEYEMLLQWWRRILLYLHPSHLILSLVILKKLKSLLCSSALLLQNYCSCDDFQGYWVVLLQIFLSYWWAVRGEDKKKMQFSSLCQVLLLYSTQTSLTGEKATLGTMLPQNPSGLEPVTVDGEAASKPASSVKPACPASTSPLNWLADLTSGNVNKENKGECFLPSRTLVCSQRDLATSVTGRTEWWEVVWKVRGSL